MHDLYTDENVLASGKCPDEEDGIPTRFVAAPSKAQVEESLTAIGITPEQAGV